jgi:hypothetical protein
MTTWLEPFRYAEHRGVTQAAIGKHLKVGNIPKSATKKKTKSGKRILINVEAADLALSHNIDEDHKRVRQKSIKESTENKSVKLDKADRSITRGMSFNEAKTFKEQYLAALKKLEYEKEKGKWLDRAEVEKQSFEICRQIRDTILNMKDRILDEIAARLGVDTKPIEDIIDKETRSALEVLSK